MNAPEAAKPAQATEIDAAQANEAVGGLSCSAAELEALTAALKQSYENLVDFTSHVIGRVAGE